MNHVCTHKHAFGWIASQVYFVLFAIIIVVSGWRPIIRRTWQKSAWSLRREVGMFCITIKAPTMQMQWQLAIVARRSASSFAPRRKSSHFSLLAVLAFDGSAMSPHFGRNKQKGREQQGTNEAEGTLGTQVNTQFYCCYSARKNVKVFVIILPSILGIK